MPSKILLADDDSQMEFLVLQKFKERIRSGELQFLFARDGIEALKLLEESPDVSVVLCDISMPRMNGLQLLEVLNERYPLLQTIILSAYHSMENIRTAMNRGAYDFLTKPLSFADVEITLDKALRHIQQRLKEIEERKRAEETLKIHQERLEDLIEERTVELKRANEHLQQEVLKHEEAEKQLQRRNQELSLISQISKMFSSTIELERVLGTVLRSVRHLLNISATSFWLLVPETGELMCRQAIGFDERHFQDWRLAPGQGITGQTAQTGKAIIVGDSRMDSRHDESFNDKSAEELRSILSIPLQVKGKVIGVLDAFDEHVDRFTKNDLRLIEPIAGAAAVAVENARLYAMAQQELDDRKKAEEALRSSEEEYRTLFENLKDVFYRVNLEGDILLVSPSVEQLLGYTSEQVVGLNMAKDVFVHSEQWEMFTMIMEGDGKLDNFEVLFKRHDGAFDWGSFGAQPYTDKEGHILGYEGIVRDISMRKQAEMQLLAAHNELQKTNTQLQDLNASKDKFFSIISHDLRSPFNVMLGYSQILDERFDELERERIQSDIKKLRKSAEGLYALLENLLTWSRIQRGAIEYYPEEIDLSDVSDENIDLFAARAEQKGITLRSMIQMHEMVYADENMVNTVIRNLVSNALKFTPSGGRIELFVRPSGDFVEVSVADTGTGINEEDIPKLFRIDAQYTNLGTDGEKGTGLGLNLCQDLVEKNGGEIWVESERGKGTTFKFTLPKKEKVESDELEVESETLQVGNSFPY